MKRFLFLIFILLVSIMIAPFSIQSYAENSNNAQDNAQDFETYYPKNILEYSNLDGVSKITSNSEYLAYTISNKLFIINKNTKETKTYSFENIQKIKFINNNNILILDNESFKNINILKNITLNISQEYNINTNKFLSNISDIYSDEKYLYLSFIEGNHFELHTFEIVDNENILLKNHQVKEKTTSTDFTKASLLSVNSSSAYIYIKNTESDNKICKINFSSDSELVKSFKPHVQILDTFFIDQKECVVTFTTESLFLFEYSNENYIESIQISIGNNTSSGNKSVITNKISNIQTETNFPLFNLSDLDFFNNTIYVCDDHYNAISTYNINIENSILNLKSDKVLIASNSSDIGRFDTLNNIYFQADKIITSDTVNHRIQIFNSNNEPQIINLDYNENPRAIVADKFENLYFVIGSTNSVIKKYSIQNNEYTFSSEFTQVNSTKLGYISDLIVDNNGNILGLDTTNDKLIKISDDKISFSATIQDLSENSQIEYLNELENIAILNNNKLFILNQENISNSPYIETTCTSITSSLNYIYAIDSSSISIIDCSNGTPKQTTNIYSNTNLENLTSINIDIANNTFWGFDKNKQCLVKFKNTINKNELIFSDITSNNSLTINDEILPILTNKSNVIYEYPFNLGARYSDIPTNTKCIGIEKYTENYYRVLFNHNNILQEGFIHIQDINIQKITYDTINVIVTNQVIPVYKYPTLLKYNGDSIVVDKLTINTNIKLELLFPISIDDKDFYLYKNGNKIGYIFSADVIADDGIHIKYFENENAQINTFGENNVVVYGEDLNTQIATITNKYRVYIEDYNKDNKYTKVTYKDSKLNTIEGYIETQYIVLDELDNSKLILILIIIISVVLLFIISISIIIAKKKK